MDWAEALELVIGLTGYERFRALCAEDNPDPAGRDAYRALVVSMAMGEDLARAARALAEAPPENPHGIPAGPGRCCG